MLSLTIDHDTEEIRKTVDRVRRLVIIDTHTRVVSTWVLFTLIQSHLALISHESRQTSTLETVWIIVGDIIANGVITHATVVAW